MSVDLGPEIWFYHLESSSVEDTLPPLIEKCLDRLWRVGVYSTSKDRLQRLDTHLWTWKPGSWLAHESPNFSAKESLAPICLLSSTGTHVEQWSTPEAIFLLDGAEWGKTDDVKRICVLFDGRDEGALTHARSQWRLAKENGLIPTYWRQSEDGKWDKNLLATA
ncbi:DNA polymerase III subunit chi [Candidatus Phycosocius spiralis]|uniref:DNA polymerase III subunit chi n=1 Tax=Candidatus Phycosocius spiralis TaxID=2815099 RepID=A0ABQ4PTF2_9PROT|nr:DNA polymerase III subunit chi [Candidatus Phycosocius spiralis]GIU66003.1 DNA polymerase III subunit chi [Candidatus Phycosocius spiralis]